MNESQEEILIDIRRFVQAGFLALVAVAEQIRDGRKGLPTPDDLEMAAVLLRTASSTLDD